MPRAPISCSSPQATPMTPHPQERSSKVPTLWSRAAPPPPLTAVLLPQPKSNVQGAGWRKHSRSAAPALPSITVSFPPLLPLAVGTSFPFIPFNLSSPRLAIQHPEETLQQPSPPPPNLFSSTCERCC